jgi:cytochrome c
LNIFEINKIIGALLATILLVIGLNGLTNMIFGGAEHNEQVAAVPAESEQAASAPAASAPAAPEATAPEAVAPEAAVPEAAVPEAVVPEAAAPAAPEAAAPAGLAAMVAAASPEAGQKLFKKKCKVCHSVDQGGKNKIGPNLYGVVGHSIAGHPGYSYSGALKDHGGVWTLEALDHWLTKPKDFAPGTKMSFGGFKKPGDRAAVIAYMMSLGGAPAALAGTE